MRFGLGFGIDAGRRGFSPASLFAAGEQGAWYDPSDFSTLYQDSAGTTPVTAVGQPVGLMLDKRLGLVPGPELVTNGTFDAGVSSWSTGAGGAISWVSGGTAKVDSIGSTGRVFTTVSGLTVGRHYRVTGTLNSKSAGTWQLFAGTQDNYGGRLGASAANATSHSFVFVATATSHHITIIDTTSGGNTSNWDNISVRELPGNHASQSTAASRPTLQQDSNGRYYLSFDGTDDGLATPSINFTSTDKMTVVAGVRKNADASTGTLLELSAQSTGAVNPGSFGIFAPRSAAAAEYSFLLCGSAVTSYSATSFAAPITNVLSAAYDIAGAARADEVKPRVNSAIPTLTGADSANAGTGNFGTYPLYIGRRGGASLPFGGRLYGLIVRGAASNAGQIAAAEAWMNGKTRAY